MELLGIWWYVRQWFLSLLKAYFLPKPYTVDFPRADIYQLIAPDLLHQIIKGTFHDHLVTWVVEYIQAVHREKDANEILADIDRRWVQSIVRAVHMLTAFAHEELPLHLHSQACGDFQTVEISSSGQVTMPKLSWRYATTYT
jgi:Plavaka transposase